MAATDFADEHRSGHNAGLKKERNHPVAYRVDRTARNLSTTHPLLRNQFWPHH